MEDYSGKILTVLHAPYTYTKSMIDTLKYFRDMSPIAIQITVQDINILSLVL